MLKRLQRQLLIRETESGTVAYFLVLFLLISVGMAIGRGSADALFLKRIGIEYLPALYMVQSLVLAMVSLVYAGFADRIIAERFFRIIFSVLAVLVLASWWLMSRSDSTVVYPFYYLTYEVASEILLVHAALYMGQNMTTLQAKRLAPLVYAGSQTGVILGGLLLAFAAPVLGTQNLLIIWCLLLMSAMLLIMAWHRRKGPSTHFRAPHRSRHPLQEATRQIQQGIRYTWSSELLRAAGFALFFMVIAFYILCYSVNRVYTRTFENEATLASFFGLLTAATSGIALLTQLFITNRAIRHFGIRRINLVFPSTTLVALATLSMSFSLPAALLGSFNKDALMPAFRNPVRAMFINVIPAYMHGRARAISVAVVLPLALFLCGLLLVVMQQAQTPTLFLLPGAGAALLYLYFNSRMNRAYAGTLIRTLRERLFLPERHLYSELKGADRKVITEITAGVRHEDPEVAIAFARLLAGSFPEQAAAPILARIDGTDSATADRFLGLLAEVDLNGHRDRLFAMGRQGDAHLQATVMHLLASQDDPDYAGHALQLLDETNPRLCAAGLHYCLHHRTAGIDPEYLTRKWLDLLQGDTGASLAALALIPELGRLESRQRETLEAVIMATFLNLLSSADTDIRLRTLRSLRLWQGSLPDAAYPLLTAALSDENPDIRSAAASCLHLETGASRGGHILRAIADSHPLVRQSGLESLKATTADFRTAALDTILENRAPLRGQFALLETLVEAGLSKTDAEQVAIRKAAEARSLQDALETLEAAGGYPATPAAQLVRVVLKERLEQIIQLALLALEPLYEPGLINTIRAGFSSRDPRHIANAGEALDSLQGGRATRLLQQILCGLHDHRDSQYQPEFASITEVIDWCAAHTDEWLRQCATYLMSQTQDREARV